MDAVDILKVCFRRWYVMLPILLGAAGVSYQLVQTQETTYTAAASYGLVQPALTSDDADDPRANPLGPGGNALVGAALEAQLNSRETQAELGNGTTRGWGPGDPVNHRSYTVEIPLYETTYEVRAWGEDEDEVRAVVDRVIKAAPDIADEAQVRVGVAPQQRYTPFVLASTQVEALPATSGMKLVIAVMGVGLLMGAAWSIVVDRALRWRRAPRRASAAAASAPGPSVHLTPGATHAADDRTHDPRRDETVRSARADTDASTPRGANGTVEEHSGRAATGLPAPGTRDRTSGSNVLSQRSRGRSRNRPGGGSGASKVGTKPGSWP